MASQTPTDLEIINRGHDGWIPEGYVIVRGPGNQHYVVPEFMVPALHQTFDGDQIKNDLQVLSASGSVSPIVHISDLWYSGIFYIRHVQYLACPISGMSNHCYLE